MSEEYLYFFYKKNLFLFIIKNCTAGHHELKEQNETIQRLGNQRLEQKSSTKSKVNSRIV